MAKILSLLRQRRKRIVFTNGCFDILHPGHIKYLKSARSFGDLLVIGLNSDRSVKLIKGRSRPLNKEADRALILASLYFVDYVTIFNESTPQKLIKKLKPDILVKGGDWSVKNIVGADFVKSRGGRIVSIPFIEGYSTTSLIKKARGKQRRT